MKDEPQDKAALYQVIVNDEHLFATWPTRRALPAGWRYVGKEGTKLELEFYLIQMAVETSPAPLIVSGKRAQMDTRW
jgi:MbtH protein